jgi:DNA-binding NarL/FixJ family response regulator
MSGIELCKIIKEQFPHIKVLILSMHNSITIVKDALNAEADGYMLKNTGQDEFIKAIERVLGDGTYFSQDILPIILNLFQKEKKETLKNALTQREKEVLELIVQEYTSKEIAEKLFISKQTVDTHRINIMQKTDCKTLVGLIKYAIQSGYIK